MQASRQRTMVRQAVEQVIKDALRPDFQSIKTFVNQSPRLDRDSRQAVAVFFGEGGVETNQDQTARTDDGELLIRFFTREAIESGEILDKMSDLVENELDDNQTLDGLVGSMQQTRWGYGANAEAALEFLTLVYQVAYKTPTP